MSKVSGPPFEGIDDPPKHLREFAAECMELAQTTPSPEKRMMYLKMAALFHQMARRRETEAGRGYAYGIECAF